MMDLQVRLRTGHVKRWQIVRVAREQTVAEHMYRVWLIVQAMLKVTDEYNLSLFTHADGVQASKWALMHDLPEVITGDIATPAKMAIRHAVPESDPVRNIELSLDSEYAQIHSEIHGRVPQMMVKLADMYEAIDFLSIEGIGPHAYQVHTTLLRQLVEKLGEARVKHSDVDWWLVHATLTLQLNVVYKGV